MILPLYNKSPAPLRRLRLLLVVPAHLARDRAARVAVVLPRPTSLREHLDREDAPVDRADRAGEQYGSALDLARSPSTYARERLVRVAAVDLIAPRLARDRAIAALERAPSLLLHRSLTTPFRGFGSK